MARINPNDADNYAKESNNSEWLSLKDDGDVARVQFLYNKYDELDVFVAHKVEVDGRERYVDCIREYDDPVDACPFCESELNTKVVMMLAMYDLNDKKVKIWERGKAFIKKMDALFNRYPDLSNMVFEIERRGKKGDQKTTYEIFPMPDIDPVDTSDIEKPNLLGSFILEKTADEMQSYINNGEFPAKDDNASRRNNRKEEPTRRSRRG